MCVSSYIGDNYRENFPDRWPNVDPYRVPYPWVKPDDEPVKFIPYNNGPTQVEFDALKKEVEELKKLLLAAKQFDEATGQKDCEMDEKIDFIKKLAKFVGVDMNEVFK